MEAAFLHSHPETMNLRGHQNAVFYEEVEPRFSIYTLGQCFGSVNCYEFAIYRFGQCESLFNKQGCINVLKAHHEDNGHRVKKGIR